MGRQGPAICQIQQVEGCWGLKGRRAFPATNACRFWSASGPHGYRIDPGLRTRRVGQGRDVAGRKHLRMREALQGGPHGRSSA